MVERFITAPATPIWVSVVSVLSFLIFCVMLALGLFAVWKGFHWLLKWKP